VVAGDGAVDVGTAMPPELTQENPLLARAFYTAMYHVLDPFGRAETPRALLARMHQLAHEAGQSIRF